MDCAPRKSLPAHNEAAGDINGDLPATPQLRAAVSPSNAGDARTSVTERTGTRHHTSNPVRPFRFSVNCPDLIASTQHLTAAAMGALMRLKLHYWISGPMPDDDEVLMRITGTSRKEWTAIRPHIEGRFDIAHGQWIHWRLDAHIEDAYSAINRNRAKTQAATRARAEKRRNERADIARCQDEASRASQEHALDTNTLELQGSVRGGSGATVQGRYVSIRERGCCDGGDRGNNADRALRRVTSFEADVLKAERDMEEGASGHGA